VKGYRRDDPRELIVMSPEKVSAEIRAAPPPISKVNRFD